MALAEFTSFAKNLFKLSHERRSAKAGENYTRLEDLWLELASDEKTEQVQSLYDRCKLFLLEILDAKELDKNKMEFSVKDANSIINDFEGNVDKFTDFLDEITYYSGLLKEAEKPKLCTFLCKVKLKGTAKSCILNETGNLNDLLSQLKLRFESKETTVSLNNKLSNLRQENKSVEKFTLEIESIVAKLSNLQISKEGESNAKIIRSLNDTLGLNTLKIGAKPSIQKILLASQAKSFAEGVSLALEAESTLTSLNKNVNFVNRSVARGKNYAYSVGRNNNYRGSFGRNHGSRYYRPGTRGNFNNGNNGNMYGNNNGYSTVSSNRINFRGNYRGNSSRRGYYRGKRRIHTSNNSNSNVDYNVHSLSAQNLNGNSPANPENF